MDNPFSNMDFKALVGYVKQLSDAQKKELIDVLSQNRLPMVNDIDVVYTKSEAKAKDFDAKWNESISSSELKEAAAKHINSLPWK